MKKILQIPQPKWSMDKHLKARDTIYDLGNHPALPSSVFPILRLMEIDIVQLCKNGHIRPDRKGCIEVRYSPENYKKYKKEFDKEFKEYTEEELKKEKRLIRIDIPYKKIYGENWKPNHIEYWGDLSFVAFVGKDFKLWHDPTKWSHFSGVSASGRTFEDMIIAIGQKFFRSYGKFNEEDFLTKKEKKNHEKEKIFHTKPSKRGSFLIPNRKYMRIEDSEINRRWIKWFSKTKLCKKQWGKTFKEILAGKEIR